MDCSYTNREYITDAEARVVTDYFSDARAPLPLNEAKQTLACSGLSERESLKARKGLFSRMRMLNTKILPYGRYRGG